MNDDDGNFSREREREREWGICTRKLRDSELKKRENEKVWAARRALY